MINVIKWVILLTIFRLKKKVKRSRVFYDNWLRSSWYKKKLNINIIIMSRISIQSPHYTGSKAKLPDII